MKVDSTARGMVSSNSLVSGWLALTFVSEDVSCVWPIYCIFQSSVATLCGLPWTANASQRTGIPHALKLNLARSPIKPWYLTIRCKTYP